MCLLSGTYYLHEHIQYIIVCFCHHNFLDVYTLFHSLSYAFKPKIQLSRTDARNYCVLSSLSVQ